jgi:acetyl esterase
MESLRLFLKETNNMFEHATMKIMQKSMASLDKPRLKKQGPPHYEGNIIEVVFEESNDIKCDVVYSINQEVRTPTCFMIHGGGLFYGDKSLNIHASVEMAKRGYNVINLNYPLLEDASLFDQLNTILKAYDFFDHYHKEYTLNMNDVVVMGDSAGAYLTLMTSILVNRKDLIKKYGFIQPNITIKAIGCICVMVTLDRSDALSFLSTLAFRDHDDELFRDIFSSPWKLIKDAPPCFIMGSEEDLLKQDTYDLLTACQSTHHLYEKLIFEKGDKHPLFHVFPITHVHYDESQIVFNEMNYFFKAYQNRIL